MYFPVNCERFQLWENFFKTWLTDYFKAFINSKDIINVVIIENQAPSNLVTIADNNRIDNLFLKVYVNVCKERHAHSFHDNTVNLKIEFIIKVETVTVYNHIKKVRYSWCIYSANSI